MAPVDTNSDACLDALFEYAHGLVYSAANDATVPARIEVFSTVPKTPFKIQQLEEIHKIADLYLWLSIRYPSYFPDHDHVRGDTFAYRDGVRVPMLSTAFSTSGPGATP